MFHLNDVLTWGYHLYKGIINTDYTRMKKMIKNNKLTCMFVEAFNLKISRAIISVDNDEIWKVFLKFIIQFEFDISD